MRRRRRGISGIGWIGRKWTVAYVSAPDVRREDLILFIEVKDLDERQPIADADRLRCVVDWSTNDSDLLVVVEKFLNQPLLIWHRHSCIYTDNAHNAITKYPKCLRKHKHSFIHSGHFYSASSSPLLLRGVPDYSTGHGYYIGVSRRSARQQFHGLTRVPDVCPSLLPSITRPSALPLPSSYNLT